MAFKMPFSRSCAPAPMLPSLGGLAGLRFCGLAARGSSSALFAQAAADFVQQVGDDAHFRNAEERAQPEHGYEADAAADDKVQKAQGHAMMMQHPA